MTNTIAVFGDSIVYGVGAEEHGGWVNKVFKDLQNDDLTHVYNLGVPGDTSELGLKRFEVEITVRNPNKVLIAFGINDSKVRVGQKRNVVSPEAYRENIFKIINISKKFTEDITLISPTFVGEALTTANGSIFTDQEIGRYVDILRDISETERLLFIDLSRVLDVETDLFDGLHPNEQGYSKIAEKIKREMI